ncbi:hypothetical protein EYC80_000631 [Monilinia laxa]|uniref:Uncharacterized protein n=1 Tax=Monilinia laxa TaxID=61186 RepID=A0A5N6KB82_MONLA|nr:hypothetical protein EYC80_000631 [Monilinia laxa]
MSIPIPISPVNNNGSLAANCTQETFTPAKHSGKGKSNSISRIPTPTGSNRSRSSTPDLSTPIPIKTFVPSNTHNNIIQNTSTSPISVITMKENIADAMVTDDIQSPDLELPQLLLNHTPTMAANMSSPILISKKGPCTTALSTSEPTPLKNPASPTEPNLMASPVAPPSSAASQIISTLPDIPHTMPASSYTSYMSFTHTPPRLPPSPSPPHPLPQTSQSTPLLSNPHHSSTPTQQTHSSPPPGYYQYHTINGTTTLPLTPEASESGHDSPHRSLPAVSPHEDLCRSTCGINLSLLCSYLLFTCSLIWLLWMSWSTITSADVGHRGIIGSEDGLATVSSYDAVPPVVTPLLLRRVDNDRSGIDGIGLPPDVEGSGEPNNARCSHRPHHPHYPVYLEYPDCPQTPRHESPDPSLENGFSEPFVVVLLHTMGIVMGMLAIISIIAILMQYDRENSI